MGGSRSKEQAWLTSHTSERPGHMVGRSHPVYLCGYMGASLAYRVEDTGNLCPWLLRAASSGAQDRNSCAWLYFFKKKKKSLPTFNFKNTETHRKFARRVQWTLIYPLSRFIILTYCMLSPHGWMGRYMYLDR